ncbi:MAG: cytochrome C biogenesis protein [Halobacteriales archaeon]
MVLHESASLIAFAFTAGVFTFFAPCAYPLLPGYISYYLGQTTGSDHVQADGGATIEQGRVTQVIADGFSVFVPIRLASRLARAVVVGLLVSAGFFLVYGVLAGVVAAVGSQILASVSVLELVVGLLLIVIGGLMAAGWDPPTPTVRLPERHRSGSNYFGFGILYGAAAAGCAAPIFIGVALQALSTGVMLSVVTFGAYAGGMSVLMIGVTIATALGRDALLNWVTQRIDRIHRGAGVLLLLAGVVQIYFFLFRFNGLRLLGF